MEHHKVWKKVKRNSIPRDRQLVKCKWVFEIKRSGVFRCRIVAKGFSQVPGQDYESVFNPVVNDVTFRIMIVLAILGKHDIKLFDVSVAFLHGEMDTLLFMEPPDGLDIGIDECLQLIKVSMGWCKLQGNGDFCLPRL